VVFLGFAAAEGCVLQNEPRCDPVDDLRLRVVKKTKIIGTQASYKEFEIENNKLTKGDTRPMAM
jgi:hypothetical protein